MALVSPPVSVNSEDSPTPQLGFGWEFEHTLEARVQEKEHDITPASNDRNDMDDTNASLCIGKRRDCQLRSIFERPTTNSWMQLRMVERLSYAPSLRLRWLLVDRRGLKLQEEKERFSSPDMYYLQKDTLTANDLSVHSKRSTRRHLDPRKRAHLAAAERIGRTLLHALSVPTSSLNPDKGTPLAN